MGRFPSELHDYWKEGALDKVGPYEEEEENEEEEGESECQTQEI